MSHIYLQNYLSNVQFIEYLPRTILNVILKKQILLTLLNSFMAITKPEHFAPAFLWHGFVH